MRQADIDKQLEDFEGLCRSKGLPLTVQRRTILEAILKLDDHPTADRIFESVKDLVSGISRTTVYRVLETLVELGVVRKIQHHGASVRYDGNTGRHHHLVCIRCNRVVDYLCDTLDQLPLPISNPGGFDISDFSVQFTGLCPDCRKEQAQ